MWHKQDVCAVRCCQCVRPLALPSILDDLGEGVLSKEEVQSAQCGGAESQKKARQEPDPEPMVCATNNAPIIP